MPAREDKLVGEVSYRLATLRDVDAMAMMSRDYIETGLSGWQWHPKRVRRNLLDAETCAVLAVLEKTVAGFAMMQFAERHAHLYLLAVRPDFRRLGVGRALMAWMEQSASIAGTTQIYLEVRQCNDAAQRFYNALGYTPVKTLARYYCGRETAVRMWRDLSVRRAVDLG